MHATDWTFLLLLWPLVFGHNLIYQPDKSSPSRRHKYCFLLRRRRLLYCFLLRRRQRRRLHRHRRRPQHRKQRRRRMHLLLL
jgi:hypothetical protein